MTPRLAALGLSAVLLTATGFSAGVPDGATEMEGVTAPAVSPDGRSMVFEWIDDLWTASTRGGEAVRVVENPALDAFPRFTPDGRRIVFSSDRSGAMQVFSIPAGGGEAVRHTFHSEGNQLESISPDSTRALVRGLRETAGLRSHFLLSVNLVKNEREQRLFEAPAGEGAAWSPDGRRILFGTGGGEPHRPGYRGSRAARVWQFDIPSGKFEPLTSGDPGSTAPSWHADGMGFHFLSAAAGGTVNLWSKRFSDAVAKQLTHVGGDGLFLRQPSADGSTFVFQRGSDLLRFQPGDHSEPQPLVLWTRARLPQTSRFQVKVSGTTDADFTPGLDQAVIAAAGELWCVRTPGGRTERLTETAAAESEVHFSPTGDWLYFLRDDGLDAQFHRAKFTNEALSDIQAITRGPRSKCRFKASPDGSRIAWVEGTGDVFTADADGSNSRRVFPCWDLPTYDWSPDGHWLAIAAEDRNANRDIWLVAADGGREPVNATRNPAFEGSPRWSPDGQRLVFSARRDDSGRDRLWQIHFGKDGLKEPVTDGRIQRLGDRAKPVSTGDREPVCVLWSADSKALWFQSKDVADPGLYSVDAANGEVRTEAGRRGVPLRMSPHAGSAWRVDQVPTILSGGKSVEFPISATFERDRPAVMELAFRRIWRTLAEQFHDPGMNGTDWQQIRGKYEPAVREARTSRQFARVIHRMCGELNTSHLAFQPEPWPEEIRQTQSEEADACPGLVFRDGEPEGPLVIARVIPGSPAALLPNAPQPGETVGRIAGEPVDNRTLLHRFFKGADGRSLPFVIRDGNGGERVIELRPISHARARTLDRRDRDTTARGIVRKGGNFCYLPVRDMSIETFNALELAVYRESLRSEGMILDLRDNGGGREADRMLSLFCQPVHAFTVPRDGPRGYPHARLAHAAWDKPLVVLCNENTFSNAEIFCHAMLETGRAPLVGVATAGGVMSAVNVAIPDAGNLQVPFRGWFRAKDGVRMDLLGAEPTHAVDLTPADLNSRQDPQLEKAIAVLQSLVAASSTRSR